MSFRAKWRERSDRKRTKPRKATFTVHKGEIFGIAGLVGAAAPKRFARSCIGQVPARARMTGRDRWPHDPLAQPLREVLS